MPNTIDVNGTDYRLDLKPSGLIRQKSTVLAPIFETEVTSALRHAICHILQISAKEEMFDAATGRVVAVVEDPHTFGNRTIHQFPREPMGTDGLCGYTGADADFAITVFSAEAGPDEAIALGHELCSQAFTHRPWPSSAGTTTVAPLSSSELVRPGKKGASTRKTNLGQFSRLATHLRFILSGVTGRAVRSCAALLFYSKGGL